MEGETTVLQYMYIKNRKSEKYLEKLINRAAESYKFCILRTPFQTTVTNYLPTR